MSDEDFAHTAIRLYNAELEKVINHFFYGDEEMSEEEGLIISREQIDVEVKKAYAEELNMSRVRFDLSVTQARIFHDKISKCFNDEVGVLVKNLQKFGAYLEKIEEQFKKIEVKFKVTEPDDLK